MNKGFEDDFGEVSGLLFGAEGRYRSARATVVRTVDRAVAEEANRRLARWRPGQEGTPDGGEGFYPGYDDESTEEPARGREGTPGGEDLRRWYEERYEAEAAEEVTRLWHEVPGRWREERDAPGGGLLSCFVSAGPRGPWRYYERGEEALEWPSVPAGERPDVDFSFMLDPSEYYFRWVLTHDTTMHKTGRRAVVAGREALELRVGTVSWGWAPRILPGFLASQEGTTDHLLLVDAEIGTVLRVAARLEGREFRVAEVAEIAYDEEFPEGTFRLEIPGVEFHRQTPP